MVSCERNLISINKSWYYDGTSFLVLSAFGSAFVLEKMLVKSIMGYALAAFTLHGLLYLNL